jgi:hypothetical protein
MIPQEKSAAVFRGLHEAFGATAIEDIRRIIKGLSSDLVFRIVVEGSPYLLTIMTHMIRAKGRPLRRTCAFIGGYGQARSIWRTTT